MLRTSRGFQLRIESTLQVIKSGRDRFKGVPDQSLSDNPVLGRLVGRTVGDATQSPHRFDLEDCMLPATVMIAAGECTGGRMRLISVVAVMATVLLIAGCGGAGDGTGAAPDSVSAASSSKPSDPSSSEQIIPSTSTTTKPTVSPSSTGSGGAVVRPGAQKLTLGDAHDPASWEEGSFEVPQFKDSVQAIAVDVGCYSAEELEFRFSLQSGVLKVAVAQSMSSENSAVTLQFTLLADKRPVDVKKIGFTEQAVLETQLDGVSVVEIVVDRTDSVGSCSETTALLTSVEIS